MITKTDEEGQDLRIDTGQLTEYTILYKCSGPDLLPLLPPKKLKSETELFVLHP